jgi:hypothetical protein
MPFAAAWQLEKPMAFNDYSTTPASNTTIGEDTFIGPNMPRDNVRPALQQLASDGRGLYDEMIARGTGNLPAFIAEGVGAVERSALAKMRDAVSVLDYGAVGDGETDDTDANNAALATGEDVHFPAPYTFLTQGLHQVTTDHQRIIIDGTIKYDGVRRQIAGSDPEDPEAVFGFQGLFQVQDQTEGVVFEGSGTLDGAWDRDMDQEEGTGLQYRDAGSGIYAYRAIGLRIDGLTFTRFSENGIKAHNCPEIIVTRATSFVDICNAGTEILSYADDPRTAVPWVGTLFGPSGDVSGFYDLIDDGEQFANWGNGVGVGFSCGPGAPSINNLHISGHFRDCLAAIWSENNYAGSEAHNIIVNSPLIQGNFRSSRGGSASSMQGIGFVGVKNSQIITPTIKNVGNIEPLPGSNTAGIFIVESDGVNVIAPAIVDDTAAVDRTQYGIIINAGTNVAILDYDIRGMADGDILQTNSPTNVRIVKLAAAQAAIANAAGGDEVAKINAILAALRTHGLIET